MTFAEQIFIISTSLVLIVLALTIKRIDWGKLGFKPKSILQGWGSILIFNIIIFTLVQLTITYKFISLPEWVLDQDPLLPLIIICFLQEILFRGLVIRFLERWGQKKALWMSIVIFVGFHMIAPYSWSKTGLIFACLTFFAGYFWGWHFLKFRNIYMLGVSHFLVNLSFNYVVFSVLS
ncbi:MAG: Type prenyl endopeptidase Rce1-like [Patescibacteria group bacterium]|nr:Type prenyl endopeptidase Rce1-like [Patescibacteria group bacterium]